MTNSTTKPLEVQSLVTLSTAHIDPTDLELLLKATENYPWFVFNCKQYPEAGYLFYTSYLTDDSYALSSEQDQLIAKGHTPGLINLWNWAISHKYDWVRLTSWGAVVPGLPTFEWD